MSTHAHADKNTRARARSLAHVGAATSAPYFIFRLYAAGGSARYRLQTRNTEPATDTVPETPKANGSMGNRARFRASLIDMIYVRIYLRPLSPASWRKGGLRPLAVGAAVAAPKTSAEILNVLSLSFSNKKKAQKKNVKLLKKISEKHLTTNSMSVIIKKIN